MENAVRRSIPNAKKSSRSFFVINFLAILILGILLYIVTFPFTHCSPRDFPKPFSGTKYRRDRSVPPFVDTDARNETAIVASRPQTAISGTKEQTGLPSALVLYELYYADNGWSSLHDYIPYQPLCVNPNMTRPNTTDIDAPARLPILMDSVYQGLICEYGAIFSVRKHLEEFQKGANWVGFQSWRAAEKERALSPVAVSAMVADMRRRDESGHNDVMYFWSDFGAKSMLDVCDGYHGYCSKVYSLTFHALFSNTSAPIRRAENVSNLKTLPKYIPAVPGGGNERHAVMSYWAMHTTQFRKYVSFAKMFAATLEGVFDLRSDLDRCPLTFVDQPRYQSRLCWCFILERVVNMWAKHAGIRMMLVDRVGGNITEIPALQSKKRWSVWFGSQFLENMERGFEDRLGPEALALYRSLG